MHICIKVGVVDKNVKEQWPHPLTAIQRFSPLNQPSHGNSTNVLLADSRHATREDMARLLTLSWVTLGESQSLLPLPLFPPSLFFFVLQGYVCTCVVVEGSRRAWARDEDASLSTDRPGTGKCTCCVCMCVCVYVDTPTRRVQK